MDPPANDTVCGELPFNVRRWPADAVKLDELTVLLCVKLPPTSNCPPVISPDVEAPANVAFPDTVNVPPFCTNWPFPVVTLSCVAETTAPALVVRFPVT